MTYINGTTEYKSVTSNSPILNLSKCNPARFWNPMRDRIVLKFVIDLLHANQIEHMIPCADSNGQIFP